MTAEATQLSRNIRARARRLENGFSDYDALIEMVGGRSLVLLGEPTHGTAEFYRMRGDITRRLIEEKGFDAVAVEADWPSAYRLNRYVTGVDENLHSDPFGEFRRFPQWMWRNREVAGFVEWLREYNMRRLPARRIGFYGLDLYSLYDSMDIVIRYLEKTDPEQASAARRIYDCLDHVRDPQQYGYQSAFKLRPSCRSEILYQLRELRLRAADYPSDDRSEERFSATQNAQLVLSAEAYYREMFGSRVNTWNLRDGHMTTVLFDLQRHLRARGGSGKIAVWAHNSHLGDARATEMGWNGERNLGQLARTRAGYDDVLLVGFTTYTGFVTAARGWHGPAEHRWVRPALPESYEHLFSATGLERFFLPLKGAEGHPLRNSVMLERAIGVVYRPETERASHYFRAGIKPQFDAVFHLDETSAVEPLDAVPDWQSRETPETYPFGV